VRSWERASLQRCCSLPKLRRPRGAALQPRPHAPSPPARAPSRSAARPGALLPLLISLAQEGAVEQRGDGRPRGGSTARQETIISLRARTSSARVQPSPSLPVLPAGAAALLLPAAALESLAAAGVRLRSGGGGFGGLRRHCGARQLLRGPSCGAARR